MLKAHVSSAAPAPIGPYSQAVEAGGWVFCSGQIALDPLKGTLVEGDTRTQARQVLHNLGAVLQAAGLGPSQVVRYGIFLVDLADFAAVNEECARFWESCPVFPARSTVQVSALPRGARVEIEAVAFRGGLTAGGGE